MSIKPLSELTFPRFDWLWPGRLPIGSLVMLDGDPGHGKSMVTLDLAARLTTGRPWPDSAEAPQPAPVILLCDEDTEAVIASRLSSLQADSSRIYLWPRLGEAEMPRFPSEIGRLEDLVERTGARLVIIDPIMAFWDRKVDLNSDAGARRALQSLTRAAERHRCSMILVRHLNKEGGRNALYRGGASIAFVAACRVAWMIGEDPKMNERCVLAQSKNNLGPMPPSLTYMLPADGPRIEWQGPCNCLAAELMANRPHPARRRAREFLRGLLSAGPRLVQDIVALARTHRISRNTLLRAKKDLKITSRQVGSGPNRRDYWRYKDQAVPESPSTTPLADAWLEDWRRKYPAPDEWGEGESGMDAA